jgi:phycocyanobilin lyase alpha subunit
MLGDGRAISPLTSLLALGLTPSLTPDLTPSLQRPEDSIYLLIEPPNLTAPYDAILEALGTLAATSAIPQIKPFLHHPTPRIQYAASRALYQLTGENQYGDRLITALNGPDLQLRRAALMDLGAIGYLTSAPAIAATLAENSLKLIAMKGVLEHQIKHHALGARSPDAIQVMDLMDSML